METTGDLRWYGMLKTQEQIERDVRHKFWIEKYQYTGQINYRNKIWKESENWCYFYMRKQVNYERDNLDNYVEYESYMKVAFERALEKFDVTKDTQWLTYVAGSIRMYILKCKEMLAKRCLYRAMELGYLEDTIGNRVFAAQADFDVRDPQDYVEETLYRYDRNAFLKTLSENDQKIIQLILEGESLTAIAEQVVHNRNTNDMRKRCLRIGKQYKEYMSG